jgi:hypothetical protein
MELLLKLGGLYNLAFAIFHILFWKIFKWDSELVKLGFLNRAIMQVLNLCLTFCFLLFSYLSFFHITELLTTGLGNAILAGIAVFWLLRAIEQIVFFKVRYWGSILFFLVFIGGAAIYAVPLIRQ